MARSTRDEMVAGAAQVLAEHGPAEASFSQVLAATGAPRGSIYHHFPGGKDQLVAEAVRWAGEQLRAALEGETASTPAEVARAFARPFRALLARRGAAAGCAVAAVVVGSAEGSPTRAAAAEVLQGWRELLAAGYRRTGVEAGAAEVLAATTVATVEGAVVVARAAGDVGLFDTVVAQLAAGLPD